ncbi:MAG: sugar-binding transcriptional regulator, partial [Chloroflexi bacterium]|nr:sugar-binding transcriptional regulator [Chloroflexota bacterium]
PRRPRRPDDGSPRERGAPERQPGGVAVVGIGTIDPSMSSLLRAGYLTPKELKDLAESGVVGDVCALMFDIEGNLLDVPLARRVVGVQADMLRQIPLVLGVACGAVKAAAIHGALRARLINALVTDGEAARRVLELSDELCD